MANKKFKPINGSVQNKEIEIHTFGSIMDSYEDALRICQLTRATVVFTFNGEKHKVTEDDMREPDDKLAAMMFRLGMQRLTDDD